MSIRTSVRLCIHPLGTNKERSPISLNQERRLESRVERSTRVTLTSSANLIKIVVRGRCWPSTGTKCAVTTAGNPALSSTPFKQDETHQNLHKLDYHPFQRGLAALTLTMPATKAPQLNAPMSFGIEINLR